MTAVEPALATPSKPSLWKGALRDAPGRERLLSVLPQLLVYVVSAAYLLPLVTDSFAGGRKEFRPLTEGAQPTPEIVDLVTLLCNGVILVACTAAVIVNVKNLRRIPVAVGLLLLAWAWAMLGLVLADSAVVRSVVLVPLVIAAIALSRPTRRTVEALGWVASLVALLSIVMGVFFPDAGRYVRPDSLSDDKPVWDLGILAGPFPSGNNLGLALAVGLPATLCLPRPWQRTLGVLVSAFALFWTFSRTAWLAAAVALALWAVLAVLPQKYRRAVAALALGGLGAIVLALPLVTDEPTAFSNRGHLWVDGLERLAARPLTGWGPNYYLEVARSAGELGNFAYHAHNQAIHLLVTGGVVLFLLVAAVFVWACVVSVRWASKGVFWPAAAMAALLLCAAFEVPLGIVDRSMFYPAVLVTLLVVLTFGAWNERQTPAAVANGVAGRRDEVASP
jgi:O-antigen ligase